jgi:Cyclic nucleotide-binding domain
METLFTLAALPVHLAFVLLAISYLLTGMVWLRCLAIAGLAGLILTLQIFDIPPEAATLWLVLLVVINAWQLLQIYRDKQNLRLPPEDADLLRSALAGLSDDDISRLLKAADWKDFQPGDILTRQDAPLDTLYFMCSGRAIVEVDKTFVTYLEKGSFIGEIAYLTGNPATARVTIDEPARVLAFSKMKMAKVVAGDEHINGILYQLLGRDLAMKMRRTNTRRILAKEDPSIRV